MTFEQIEQIRLEWEARANAMNQFMMAEVGYFNMTGGLSYWTDYLEPTFDPSPTEEISLIPLNFKQK